MADRSAIEWTDATWNPIRARNKITGKLGWHCEHATTGCEFCYAEGFNKRLGTRLPFKPGHRKDVDIFCDDVMLTQPLRWKKPRKIFVCSMTDLFADFVTDEIVLKVLDVMRRTSWDGGSNMGQIGGVGEHTYQILTKRAARMASLMARLRFDRAKGMHLSDDGKQPTILKNLWLGVSAERQEEADERIPLLLQTPAAVRFISAEPLLGPIDLTSIKRTRAEGYMRPLDGRFRTLDWVIAGGESGPHARAMHPDWARGLRDQCRDAGVAFFFKQWGEWAPSTPDQAQGNPRSGWRTLKAHPHVARAEELYPEAGAAFIERVCKANAGRHLDGELHNEFPNQGG
jgi:protein gp37